MLHITLYCDPHLQGGGDRHKVERSSAVWQDASRKIYFSYFESEWESDWLILHSVLSFQRDQMFKYRALYSRRAQWGDKQEKSDEKKADWKESIEGQSRTTYTGAAQNLRGAKSGKRRKNRGKEDWRGRKTTHSKAKWREKMKEEAGTDYVKQEKEALREEY